MNNSIIKSILLLFLFTLSFSITYGADKDKNKLAVRNAISVNGDNINSYFAIEGINRSENRNNEVKIFNRWGVEVFSTKGYDGDTAENTLAEPQRVFRGISDGRATFGSDRKLPSGTYFYTLTITTTGGGQKSQSGYLYIN